MKKIEEVRVRDEARERLLTLLMSLDMKKIEKILAMVTVFLMANLSTDDQEQSKWKN